MFNMYLKKTYLLHLVDKAFLLSLLSNYILKVNIYKP